jgi:hypothetical protein
VANAAASRTLAATRPATAPAGRPRFEVPQTREQKVINLLDYLEADYAKKAAAPFWVSRAMGVVSLARSPRPTATTKLLEICEADKHDVVRLLAWQAVLARAPDLDDAARQRWANVTLSLADKDAFRAGLRAPLLAVLAAGPPSPRAKRAWQKVFDQTSAWEPQDVPVLDALGRTLSAWRSPLLAETLIKALGDPNACVRAEYVLRAAGSDVPRARDRLDRSVFNPQARDRAHPSSAELWRDVQADATAWLRANRADWKEVTKPEGEPWKDLRPAYVAAPTPLDEIDPSDPAWTGDLELGRADLDAFEAVFVVDATGSMGQVLAWLRRDVSRVMAAFAALAKEAPSVGLVYYRDRDTGDAFTTKVTPLTMKVKDLEPVMAGMTAEGGGDVPEAVREALADAVNKIRWNKNKRTGKLVVLIGDAPPKPGTEADCAALAAKAKEAGIRLYAVKVTTARGRNDLSSFDAIAAAGGGTTVAAAFDAMLQERFVAAGGKEIPIQTIDRPEAQLAVAPPLAETPGEQVLAHVLADAIHPQYRDRVEPLARTLLAHVAGKPEPERRLAFAADTPPLEARALRPQGVGGEVIGDDAAPPPPRRLRPAEPPDRDPPPARERPGSDRPANDRPAREDRPTRERPMRKRPDRPGDEPPMRELQPRDR